MDKSKGNLVVAPLLVLVAGVLWGTMGIYVRTLTELQFTTIEIVAVRAVVTALILFVTIFVFKREYLKIRLKDIWCFVGTGILSILFFNYCYFKAITMTSMSVAAILLYTAPAIVMVLSAIFFHERITKVKVIALIATFVGCVFVTGLIGDVGSLSPMGILVGFGAGFGYALYSIFSRFALERGYHSLTISAYTFLFATIGVLPMADIEKVFGTPVKDLRMAGFYLVFAMISTVIPYFVYTLGLSKMENGQASIIASVEPVAASLIGFFVFGEMITLNGFIGIILVLGAIVLCNWKPIRKKGETS